MVRLALDLVARFAMQTPAVQALLDKTVPHTTAPNVKVSDAPPRRLPRGRGEPGGARSDALRSGAPRRRFMRLLKNVAEAGPNFDVGGGISIGMRLDAPIVKLTLGVAGRVDIATGETRVSIEADSRWIKDHPPPGLASASSTFPVRPSRLRSRSTASACASANRRDRCSTASSSSARSRRIFSPTSRPRAFPAARSSS